MRELEKKTEFKSPIKYNEESNKNIKMKNSIQAFELIQGKSSIMNGKNKLKSYLKNKNDFDTKTSIYLESDKYNNSIKFLVEKNNNINSPIKNLNLDKLKNMSQFSNKIRSPIKYESGQLYETIAFSSNKKESNDFKQEEKNDLINIICLNKTFSKKNQETSNLDNNNINSQNKKNCNRMNKFYFQKFSEGFQEKPIIQNIKNSLEIKDSNNIKNISNPFKFDLIRKTSNLNSEILIFKNNAIKSNKFLNVSSFNKSKISNDSKIDIIKEDISFKKSNIFHMTNKNYISRINYDHKLGNKRSDYNRYENFKLPVREILKSPETENFHIINKESNSNNKMVSNYTLQFKKENEDIFISPKKNDNDCLIY